MQSRVNKMSKAKQQQKTFQVVDMSKDIELSVIDIELFNAEKQLADSIAENAKNAAILKNKSLIKIAKRTFANSVLRRNDMLTETAMIDIITIMLMSIQADFDTNVTVQLVIKALRNEFKIDVSRNRLIDHYKKNAYFKKHVTVSDNDTLTHTA